MGLSLLTLGVIGRLLLTGFGQVRAALAGAEWPYLVGAFVCLALGTGYGAVQWWLIVRALGGEIALGRAVRVHLTANLAKYLPGYLWQPLGKVYLSERAGLPRPVAIVSLGTEVAVIIGAGVGILLVFAPAMNGGIPLGGWWVLGVAIGGGMIGVIVGLRRWPLGARWRAALAVERVNWPLLGLVSLGMGGAWCLAGLALYLTVRAFQPVGWEAFPLCVLATALAFLGGLLVLPAPNGLGVREGLLVVVLASVVSPALGSLVAVLLRLLIVGEETLWFLFIRGLALRPRQIGVRRPDG